MHELGVVFYIIDEVKTVADENQASQVSKVTLQLGELSTVIPSLLTDCWNWARKKHDLIREAELAIETIPGLTLCGDCGNLYPTAQYGKTCPRCFSGHTWLHQGTEFLIKEIEVT